MSVIRLFSVLATVLLLVACGPTTEDARQYNDRIADWTHRIEAEAKKFETMMGGDDMPDSTQLFALFKNLEQTIDSATADVNTLSLEGGDSLKLVALEYFKFSKRIAAEVLPNMFKKVFGLLRNPDDVTPEQAVAFQQEAEQVAQTMEKEEDEIMARFLAQQNALAARYGFVIESTPESR